MRKYIGFIDMFLPWCKSFAEKSNGGGESRHPHTTRHSPPLIKTWDSAPKVTKKNKYKTELNTTHNKTYMMLHGSDAALAWINLMNNYLLHSASLYYSQGRAGRKGTLEPQPSIQRQPDRLSARQLFFYPSTLKSSPESLVLCRWSREPPEWADSCYTIAPLLRVILAFVATTLHEAKIMSVWATKWSRCHVSLASV